MILRCEEELEWKVHPLLLTCEVNNYYFFFTMQVSTSSLGQPTLVYSKMDSASLGYVGGHITGLERAIMEVPAV